MGSYDTHPALYPAPAHEAGPHGHFVPEGWEDLERGVCPCGELVAWDAEREAWVPDRSLRLLVLTAAEAADVDRVGLVIVRNELDLQAG